MTKVQQWMVRVAIWTTLVLWGTSLVVFFVLQLPEKEPPPEPEESMAFLKRITIHTPTETRVIQATSMPLESLRREYFTEGKERTKVTIYHGTRTIPGPFGSMPASGWGKVTVEFTPDSELSSDERGLGVENVLKTLIVPGGSVVVVTVDGVLVSHPVDLSNFEEGLSSYHYRFEGWERSFAFPLTESADPYDTSIADDWFSFVSRVRWSCESGDGGGGFEHLYILEPTPDVFAELVKVFEQYPSPELEIKPGSAWEEYYTGPIRRRHGLSKNTKYKNWDWRSDDSCLVGLDLENGVVAWCYSDPS